MQKNLLMDFRILTNNFKTRNYVHPRYLLDVLIPSLDKVLLILSSLIIKIVLDLSSLNK